MHRMSTNRLWHGALAHGILIVGAVASTLPFLWMVWISAVPQAEIFGGQIFPRPTLEALLANYTFALTNVPLLRFMWNGALVCFLILILQIVIAVPCGYALAKLSFEGSRLLFVVVLVSLLIPIQIPAIPLYVAIAMAGLVDTYTSLVLPWISSAFAIFLFRQFFRTFATEILDAARLDGYSELAIVWRIVFPNAWPAVAAFSIFSIVAHWNDLYWPMVVITEPGLMTPPLGIAFFRQSGDASGNVGALMAGGVIVTMPLVLVFLFVQRHFLRGLALQAH